jgi:hypothetical protein
MSAGRIDNVVGKPIRLTDHAGEGVSGQKRDSYQSD